MSTAIDAVNSLVAMRAAKTEADRLTAAKITARNRVNMCRIQVADLRAKLSDAAVDTTVLKSKLNHQYELCQTTQDDVVSASNEYETARALLELLQNKRDDAINSAADARSTYDKSRRILNNYKDTIRDIRNRYAHAEVQLNDAGRALTDTNARSFDSNIRYSEAIDASEATVESYYNSIV